VLIPYTLYIARPGRIPSRLNERAQQKKTKDEMVQYRNALKELSDNKYAFLEKYYLPQ